jgi:hypothetical protein
VARPPIVEEWHIEAVALMAQLGCGLKEAATILEVDVTSEECNKILRRSGFNRLLWEARHRYFSNLGSDPNFKKDTAIGMLLDKAKKLDEIGEFDKSAEVLFKIAKMTGWVGPESTISVFGELSQRDMDTIRTKIAQDAVQKRVN